MTEKFDPEFDAIRAALVSRPELTKDLNVSLRNVLRLTEHLKNSGLKMERHGRWIPQEDTYGDDDSLDEWYEWVCSECRTDISGEDPIERRLLPKYCPHCGAKMDGGDGGC